MRGCVRRGKVAELKVGRYAERVSAIALALAREWCVYRQTERAEPRRPSALHEIARDPPVAVRIELKPARPVRRGGDRLEAAIRHRARAEDCSFLSGGARGGCFGLDVTEPMEAHWGHEDRKAHRCAEHRRTERASRDPAKHARHERDARPGRAILG